MLTKDIVLKKILESGTKGKTRSDIYGKKTSEKEALEKIIDELKKEGKILEKNKRLYGAEQVSQLPVKKEEVGEGFVKMQDFLTLKELFSKEIESLKKEVKELRGLIYQFKSEIDRAYDYINDIFIYLKEPSHEKVGSVDVDLLKMIYDNLNETRHFGDSVPVPIFKDEVKKHVAISDEEIDKILLDLDSKEIIYLQTLDNPGDFSDSDRGIKFQGRILYFITWTKREY